MKVKLYILSFVLLLLTVACTTVEQDLPSSKADMTFVAEWAEMQTKTAFQADGTSIWWSPSDEICIYYGASEGNKFISTNDAEVPKAEFRGTLNAFTGESEAGVAYYFWAVYPYESAVSCDGESVVASLADEQMAKAGTFAPNTNIAIAKSTGLNLSFYNACSWFRFSVTKEGVKRVIFRGNNDEDVTGKFRVFMGEDNRPTAPEVIEGKKEITLHLPDYEPFEVGKIYYITLFPQVFTKGFTVTFKTDTEIATRSISAKATFLRSKYNSGIGFDSPEKGVVYTEDPNAENLSGGVEGGTESGLYLGISTFDYVLQYNPVHLISEETLESYNKIVDDMQLATEPNTLLYYSIDEDITSMKKVQLPSDLFYVALVTFTDGLDQGSMSKRRGLYMDDLEFLEDIHHRLKEEQVSGQYIKSYAIGLRGDDARSNLALFDKNLELIASEPQSSSEQYVYKVDNMSGVNSAFESIASQLTQNFKVQRLSLRIPFPSGNGAKIRFTLDNKTADASSKYIEGTFDINSYSLTNVQYVGISSSSGSEVPFSEDDGDNFTYVFEDIPAVNGAEITADNIRHWHRRASETSWTENSEFKKKENAKTFTEFKSAMVMLNLDLSMSLEGQLPTLQQSVKSFISRLYSASVDPDVIKDIRLNRTSLDLIIGQSETLQTTISPSTASGNNLQWSSAIPSVATVDNSGKVTGVSEGTTIISVSTADGKEMATCVVTVRFQHVENISLDKTQLQLYVGKTATLAASISPSNANNQTITWTSSNPDIATVNDNGVVTAIAEGNAIITVSSVDGNKTATCSVSVALFIPSSTPRDLTLAVSLPSGGRYFLQKDDLQYVNLDDYIVEGLYVVGISAFIVALKDASTDSVCYDAANTFFHLPDGDQGVSISARFKDINTALVSFGGNALSTYYYWTSEQGSSSSLHKCIEGSGGSLTALSNTNKCRVREVVPLSYESPWSPVTTTTGLFLSVSNGNTRQLLTTADDIPAGFLPEGLAIEAKGTRIIISLSDASSDSMTYSSAYLLYGSTLPNQNQGKLISSRFSDINRALQSYGGKALSTYYYWTSQNGSSSGTHQCIEAAGGSLTNVSDSNKCLVRLIVANNW